MKAFAVFFFAVFCVINAREITPEQAADLEELLADNFALLDDAKHFDFDKLQSDAFAEIDEQDWDWKDLAKNEVTNKMNEVKAAYAKLKALKAPTFLQTSGDDAVEEKIVKEVAEDSEIEEFVNNKDFEKAEAAAKAKIDTEDWTEEEKETARKEVDEHLAKEREEGDGEALLQEPAVEANAEQQAQLDELLSDNILLMTDAEHFDFDKLQSDAFAEVDATNWDWKELAKKEITKSVEELKISFANLKPDADAAAETPALLQTSGDDVEEQIVKEVAEDDKIAELVNNKEFDKAEAAAKAKINTEDWTEEEKETARKEVDEHIAKEREEGDGMANLDSDLQFLFDE